MEKSRFYEEVRCDYIDENDNFWRVDAWKHGNEQGEVVAYIDDLSGRVLYNQPLAITDELVKEVIEEKVKEIKDKPFDTSLAVPWAKYQVDEEKLDEMIKSDCSDFREVFLETITSDEDNEFPELLREYKALNASGRSVIDSVFVRMCGWSVPTLIRMAEERSKK